MTQSLTLDQWIVIRKLVEKEYIKYNKKCEGENYSAADYDTMQMYSNLLNKLSE